jgi:hypothetical protein
MEYRHEWRPLPAFRHIGRAKIINDLDPQPSGKSLAVAELDSETALRPVQDCLPVEPHKVHVFTANRFRRQKRFNSFRMADSNHCVGWRQLAWTCAAVIERGRFRSGPP